MGITIEEVGAAPGIAKTHEDGPKPKNRKTITKSKPTLNAIRSGRDLALFQAKESNYNA